MEIKIFYSWQSDLPSKTNKTFIEKTILCAIKNINSDQKVLSVLDRDTKNEFGSPNIVDTVLSKINHCKFFICDISFVNANTPNPNVLIELASQIKEFINIIDFWMEESGDEFILEPRHYMIDHFHPTVHEVNKI